MELLKLQDIIPFGKLKGKIISEIWNENPAYFDYLVKRNKKFILDMDVLIELRKSYPNEAIRIKRLTKANLAKIAKINEFRIDEEQVEDYRDTIDYEEQERDSAIRNRYYEMGGLDFDLWKSSELDDIDCIDWD